MAPEGKTSAWRETSLGEVATWLSGGTPTKANPAFWGGDVPWVSPKDMKVFRLSSTQDTVTARGVDAGTRTVPEGSVFLVVRGMILAHTFPVCIAGRTMAFNQDVKALVPAPGVDGRFLGHWFVGHAHQMLGLVTESTHGTKRIDLSDLTRFSTRIPTPEEQARIAEVLDTVDEAIRTTEQVIAKLEQVKRGLLHDLLTKGIDDNGEIRDPERHPEQFKDSPLGRIPKAWDVSAVSALLSTRFPGEWGANPAGARGNVKVLRSTNLDSDGHVDLFGGAERVVPARVLAQKRLRDGDLLLEASGGGPETPVGRVALFTEPDDERTYCVSNFFRTLRPNRGLVVPAFLNWLLLARYRHPSIWRCQQQTTGIINLKMAEYERTLVRVPTKDEQVRTIAVLQRHEGRESSEREMLGKLRLLKKGLMDDLLTGRVRTLIDSRNP